MSKPVMINSFEISKSWNGPFMIPKSIDASNSAAIFTLIADFMNSEESLKFIFIEARQSPKAVKPNPILLPFFAI